MKWSEMAEERRLQSSETGLRFVFPVPPFYNMRLDALCIVTQKNSYFLQVLAVADCRTIQFNNQPKATVSAKSQVMCAYLRGEF